MKLLFVTSNPHKIESAEKNLAKYNIEVEGVKVEGIQEIQADSIEDISIDKAKKAYEQIQKPLMVSDAGWAIPALKGFPGPIMAYINKCFSSKDFLNLMKDKEDKSIKLIECITYIDKSGYKVFKQKLNGCFLDHEEGEGDCLDNVVTFREDKKSVAKCRNEGLLAINQSSMWKELGQHLSNIE
jgi:non-canonical purine NTP pyrophosphatase (RdgB/HAM1 family)